MSPSVLTFTNIARDNDLPPYTPLILKSMTDGNSINIVDPNKLFRLMFQRLPEGQPFPLFHSVDREPRPVKSLGGFKRESGACLEDVSLGTITGLLPISSVKGQQLLKSVACPDTDKQQARHVQRVWWMSHQRASFPGLYRPPHPRRSDIQFR